MNQSINQSMKFIQNFLWGLPVMPNKLNFVSMMAGFDAIYTYSISVRRVTCSTSIKVVHWETRVGRNFVKTLSIFNCFLHGVLVFENLIRCNCN